MDFESKKRSREAVGMWAKDRPAIAEITDAYYRVRTGHDYGVGHGDFNLSDKDAAVACAKAQIKPIPHGAENPQNWIKVSIETRWTCRYVDPEAMGDAHAGGFDRHVGSFEVTLTDDEKAEKLGKPVMAGLS